MIRSCVWTHIWDTKSVEIFEKLFKVLWVINEDGRICTNRCNCVALLQKEETKMGVFRWHFQAKNDPDQIGRLIHPKYRLAAKEQNSSSTFIFSLIELIRFNWLSLHHISVAHFLNKKLKKERDTNPMQIENWKCYIGIFWYCTVTYWQIGHHASHDDWSSWK